MGFCRLSCIAA